MAEPEPLTDPLALGEVAIFFISCSVFLALAAAFPGVAERTPTSDSFVLYTDADFESVFRSLSD